MESIASAVSDPQRALVLDTYRATLYNGEGAAWSSRLDGLASRVAFQVGVEEGKENQHRTHSLTVCRDQTTASYAVNVTDT